VWPVSVIVPCFNEPAERIAHTVKSAIYALADEVIVIDDGSVAVPEVPLGPNVHLYSQEHGGIASAINSGVERALNDYVCTLGVGDAMTADRLGLQVTAVENAQYLACFSDYIDGVSGEPRIAAPDWRERLWYDNQFSLSTALMHKAAINAVGGFDESLQYSVDWKFSLQIAHTCGWLYVPEMLGEAGEHPGGHTDRARTGALWKKKCYDAAMVSRWARKHERLRHGVAA